MICHRVIPCGTDRKRLSDTKRGRLKSELFPMFCRWSTIGIFGGGDFECEWEVTIDKERLTAISIAMW